MLHTLQQTLRLIDALGDFGTGVVLLALGMRNARAIARRLLIRSESSDT